MNGPSSRGLTGALIVTLALAIAPLGFAVQYTRSYFRERAGKSIEAQELTMKGVPWFKPEYKNFVRRLSQALPPDAGILIEPNALLEPNPGGRTRWFLYLSNDLYPHRVYVHGASWASGTLVEYPEWIRLNLEELDTDGSGLADIGAILNREDAERAAAQALRERGVDWKLSYPISTRFRIKDLALSHWQSEGDSPGWVRIDLDAFLKSGEVQVQ